MADPNLQRTNPLDFLNQTLDLFNGRSSTSTTSPTTVVEDPTTTTSTTRSNMTDAQLQAIIGSAMAPVNAAQHGAGMYGSTPLAIARGQIAAETAAKNAGTTTTNTTSGSTRTSSGGTTTQATPGLAARAASALPSFLMTQVGAPALKKLISGGFGNPFESSIAEGTSFPDMISSLGQNDLIGADAFGTEIAGDALSSITATGDTFDMIGAGDVLGSFGDAIGAGDIISGAGDFIEGAGDFIDFGSFFKNGGLVKASGKKPGYASGGTVSAVDRNRAALETPVNPTVNPIIAANGAVDPNGTDPRTAPRVTTPAPTIRQTTNAQVADQITGDAGTGGANNGTTASIEALSAINNLSPQTVANIAMTQSPLGLLSTIANIAMTPSLSDIAPDSSLSDNQDAEDQAALDAAMADMGDTSTDASEGDVGTGDMGDGVGSPGGGADGGGAADGSVGGTLANGGHVSGPGTGTSDSIDAKLSDGETVVTARTTALAKKHLGDDFFLKLEQAFNPAAAMAQVAKGRA